MADYQRQGDPWANDVAPAINAPRLNAIEDGILDAVTHHKVGPIADRPPAGPANKNWLWIAPDAPLAVSDGVAWHEGQAAGLPGGAAGAPKTFTAGRTADYLHAAGDPVVFDGDNVPGFLWDDEGWYDPATGIFQPTESGYFQVEWTVTGDISGSFMVSQLQKNGDVIAEGNWTPGGTATTLGHRLVFLNGTTDFVRVVLQHNDADGVNILGHLNGAFSFFSGVKVGSSGGGEEPEPVHLVGESGEPPFGAGWQNFGGLEQPTGFYKKGERVYLQGLPRVPGQVLGGQAPIFVLPPGYIPPFTVRASTQSAGTFAAVTITGLGAPTPGQVLVESGTDFASLDEINFRVA